MGFVTFASFDDTLSICHKKSIDKSFFSPEISLRTAVTFFMVRSVFHDFWSQRRAACLEEMSAFFFI